MNRLISAAESGAGTAWSRSYGYDRFGNRAVTANSGLPTSPLMPTAKTNFSTSTNRLTLTGARYDNSGNLTATSLGDTLAYDAENRLTSYTYRNATTTYKYGPEGRRVRKATPTVTETYVYDAFGKLAAEYSTAAPTSGGTFYRTTDHLGSTRLVTKQDKSDADCHDYAPFGEEIPNTLGSRSSNACFAASFDGRQKFTGKERDDESDLDYFLARYYSGPMGRFLSVDPENAGADPEFPQTWNAYAYVANNPLKYVDRNGEYLATAWSVANVAIGVASFASNIKQGNYVAATVDAVGVALDVAATTTGLPGGAGTALRVARAADKLATATGAARTAVKGVDAVDTATDAERVLTKAATGTDIAKGRGTPHTLEPGPFAKESIPGHPGRPTAAEQKKVNDLMKEHGCHTCGTKDPKTPSGNAVADHQPPQALGKPERFFPHCIGCARRQGGQVLRKKLEREADQ